MTDEMEMDVPEDSGLPEDEGQASAMPESDAVEEGAGDEVAVAQDDQEEEVPPGLDQLADELSPLDSEEDEFKVVNEDDTPEDEAEAAMLAMLEGLPEDDAVSAR